MKSSLKVSPELKNISHQVIKTAFLSPLEKDLNREISELESLLDNFLKNRKINFRNANDMLFIARACRLIEGYKRTNHKKIPRYFLTTLMKSGTKHVEELLFKVYQLRRFTPSCDHEDVNKLVSRIKPTFYEESEFLFGDSFVSYHILPGKDTLRKVVFYQLPVIILLRNPAQALISQFFYCKKHGYSSNLTYAPGEYYGPYNIDDDDKLIDFLVRKVFPRTIDYIYSWQRAKKFLIRKGIEPLILYHEQLVRNPLLFHQGLHSYLEINQKFNLDLCMAIKNHNFRKGKTDEWQEFFVGSQLKYLKSTIDKLLSLFPELEEFWN